MKATELKTLLQNGGLEKYAELYQDTKTQTERFLAAIDAFSARFGEDRDIAIFSVPGRSEILGNHTDHNYGCVLAGAIDRDIIAVAAKNEDGVIRFHSEGYPEDLVDLSLIDDPERFENYTSGALIAGLAQGFVNEGYAIGGYDAYTVTEVLKGSGISSSAAYEVMIGNILNHLYNDSRVSNETVAKLSQFAENVYFGKPSGLMDQMACSVGGFVAIDFKDVESPIIENVNVDFDSFGHALCIIDTKGDHADLTPDYAAIPAEMKAIANYFSVPELRHLCKHDIILNINILRDKFGDRAVLRALHFFEENKRVEKLVNALKRNDFQAFLDSINESGNSSYKYLQNVFSSSHVEQQGLGIGLNIAEFALQRKGASRVHGGGFAGTIQAFVPFELLKEFKMEMEKVFGGNTCHVLKIRPVGGCEVKLDA